MNRREAIAAGIGLLAGATVAPKPQSASQMAAWCCWGRCPNEVRRALEAQQWRDYTQGWRVNHKGDKEWFVDVWVRGQLKYSYCNGHWRKAGIEWWCVFGSFYGPRMVQHDNEPA
jgi:hypothetical protein